MKRISGLMMMALAFGASLNASAATYSTTSQIAWVRTHETGNSLDWFALTGVTSLGNCAASDGLIVFRLRDDDRGRRNYSMVLAAKLAGASITASVDDTEVDSGGFCYVRYIQLN